MSTLHTISRSPSQGLLGSCLKTTSPGDAILFIEDGVYHGIDGASLSDVPADISLFGLREDLVARGVLDRQLEHIEVIGYHRFVELTVEFAKTVSWF